MSIGDVLWEERFWKILWFCCCTAVYVCFWSQAFFPEQFHLSIGSRSVSLPFCYLPCIYSSVFDIKLLSTCSGFWDKDSLFPYLYMQAMILSWEQLLHTYQLSIFPSLLCVVVCYQIFYMKTIWSPSIPTALTYCISSLTSGGHSLLYYLLGGSHSVHNYTF